MIKKSLLGLGIIFTSFIGFCSSAWVVRDNGNYGYSTLDNTIDLNVVNKGQLLSQKFGNTKRMLAFSSKNNSSNNQNERIFFFWSNGQKPYYFVNYNGKFYQGFVKTYYICPLDFSSVNALFNGCNKYNINDNFAVEVGGFFDSITIDDTWGYDISTWNCYANTQLNNRVCFSSSSLNQSICFAAGGGNNNSSCACYDCGNTTNSLNIGSGVDFTQISDNILNTPPGFQNNIEGGSSIGNNVSMTGNLMYDNSCTNGYVVSKVSSWYGGINNVCYAGTFNTGIINDGVAYSPINTGLSYRDLYKFVSDGSFGYYSSFSDWFNSWADSMKRYKLGQIQFDIFNGQPVALYAYFNRLYDSAGIDGSVSSDSYNVVNFCNLALYSDYSEPYKGNYFSDVCSAFNSSSDSPVVTTGEIGNVDDEEILPPGYDISSSDTISSGNIVSVNWSGTLSGNTNQNFDGKNFINSFYQKLQSVFQKPVNSATGIIPGYILVFLVAIILFRFIQH